MIISIKSSKSGGSSRGLIHYLAHSKLEREKEGVEKREFFSEFENDLDVRSANRHLSNGNAKPKPEELMHIVVAPSKEEIQSVGDDLQTQKSALKVIIRETIARLEKEVKAKKLKWVAALHFNTDNPHAHLAVQKEFLNENGKPVTLRINRQMLHYNEVTDGGEKKLHKGALILAAENKIEEIAQTRHHEQKKSSDSEPEKVNESAKTQSENSKQNSSDQKPSIPNFNERRILAEEMLTASEVLRRERNIENLIEHGDKKRFKIKDERTGKPRHISHFDIERKIEIVSRRKARLIHPKNTEKRAELTSTLAKEERFKAEPVTEQLETIRRHVLGFENRHLAKALEKHTRLHNQKLLIEKKYERLQIAVPLPLFNTDEIQKLQSEAFRKQNSEKILHLEDIRQSNALELNRPSRRDENVRELLAAKIVAKLKLEAAEKRLLALSANKDFTKVGIGDSIWSHRGLEQHEFQSAKKNDLWTLLKSKTGKVLFRSGEKSAPAEKFDYPALHKAVDKALLDLETVRRDEIKQKKEFNHLLARIIEADTNPNKTKLTPAFSAYELAETEDLSLEVGSENFYENSLLLQENWLLEKLAEKIGKTNSERESPETDKIDNQNSRSAEAGINGKFRSETDAESATEKLIGSFILARAEARIILARTNVNESKENLEKYSREKLFFKHRITDKKTGEEREVSLRDVEPRKHYYLIDSILERTFESKQQKELRTIVHQAAQNKEKELTKKLTDNQNRSLRLENQKAMLREKYAGVAETPPIFTPKEITALDVRAARTLAKSETERLEKIVSEAEKKIRVGRIHNLLEDTAKKLEILAPLLTLNLESKTSRQNDATQKQQTTSDSREIHNQSVASETIRLADHNSSKAEAVEPEKSVIKEKGRTR